LFLTGLVACVASASQSPAGSPSTAVPGTSAATEPSLRPSLPLPSGMVLPPIVDPDRAGPPYARGEAVAVDGVTLVYRGTFRTDGRYVARFGVTGNLPSPPGALFFLPSGPSAGLEVFGDEVTSTPFRLSGDPDPSTLFAWLIGSQTVVWELGSIEGS